MVMDFTQNSEMVSIHEWNMAQLSVQFLNENFIRWARPHKGLWRGGLHVRRSRKPAENAAQRKKGHLWMDLGYRTMG